MNPYFINEPAVISTSGGRSSMYMLKRIIDAHDGALPSHLRAVFANTGKEMEETLVFVRDCANNWDVDIAWIELSSMENIGTQEKPKYEKSYREVDFESASRHGEPFNILLNVMPAIPNIVNMACTAYLKTRIMRMWADDHGFDRGCLTVVGMRADEAGRVANLHGKMVEGFEGYCPLYLDQTTKQSVTDFWSKTSSFDLALPNNNGVTDWGNCDLCYKKAGKKKLSIIRERPELADWWAEAERIKGQQFRPDEPSYSEMQVIARDQEAFDFGDYESMPCFCAD